MSLSPEENRVDTSMGFDKDEAQPKSSFRPYTKAERIQQLNEIDKNITQLLRSAGLAIKTLTHVKKSSNGSTGDDPRDFPMATNIYLDELHSVDIRLKRQIHGLVEAGIISKEAQSVLGKAESQNIDAARAVPDRGWDVGWLNTRSNKVGSDMEAELWAKAKTFLVGLSKEKVDSQVQASNDELTRDEEMAD